MRAAFSGGTREVRGARMSRTAGGISPPVRRVYHSASCERVDAPAHPPAQRRGGDHESPCLVRGGPPRPGLRRGELVGEPADLGVDQEVRTRRVECHRHAVGLDRHAGFGRAAIVARPRSDGTGRRGSSARRSTSRNRSPTGCRQFAVLRGPGLQGLVPFGRSSRTPSASPPRSRSRARGGSPRSGRRPRRRPAAAAGCAG